MNENSHGSYIIFIVWQSLKKNYHLIRWIKRPTLVEGGMKVAGYNKNDSGWFDMRILIIFFSCVLPSFCGHSDGPKVLISGNLASHLFSEVIESCNGNNIHLVFTTTKCNTLTPAIKCRRFSSDRKRMEKTELTLTRSSNQYGWFSIKTDICNYTFGQYLPTNLKYTNSLRHWFVTCFRSLNCIVLTTKIIDFSYPRVQTYFV